MKTKSILLIPILAFFSLTVNSQERVIRGIVTTFDSIALVNAEVEVVSSGAVTETDTAGNFEVVVSENDRIKVSAEGYNNQNVNIGENTKIVLVNLHMESDPQNREMSVGYGDVQERKRLNAVTSLEDGDIDFSNYSNVYDLISGQFPGVRVLMRPRTIIIRGGGTISQPSDPIVDLDGAIYDVSILDSIDPSEIRKIDIIRDAASIYGTRGANGVIVIRTKRG